MYLSVILSPCLVPFFILQCVSPILPFQSIRPFITSHIHFGGFSYTTQYYCSTGMFVWPISSTKFQGPQKQENFHIFLILMQKKMNLKRKGICKKIFKPKLFFIQIKILKIDLIGIHKKVNNCQYESFGQKFHKLHSSVLINVLTILTICVQKDYKIINGYDTKDSFINVLFPYIRQILLVSNITI